MKTTPDSITEVYTKVLQLHPELWQVAQLTIRARATLSFPLHRYEDLLPLANNRQKSTWSFGPIRRTLADAKRYFPESLFPIEDEDDFIAKVLIVLLWGKKAHEMEAELAYPRKSRAQHSRRTA